MSDTTTPFKKFLAKSSDVTHLRLQYLDYAGILRDVVLTKSFAQKLGATERSYALEATAMYEPPNYACIKTAPIVGKCELVPDWTSLRKFPGHTEHATVMCLVASSTQYPQQPYAGCPRVILQRKIAELKKEFQEELLLSFEVGFSYDDVTHRSDVARMIDEATIALEGIGIPIRGYRRNSIFIDYLPILSAIDALTTVQQTIKELSQENGFKASVYHRDNFPSLRFSSGNGDTFMAGILHYMPSLLAFTLPSFDCWHKNVKTENNSMGLWVSWGHNNPHVPLSRAAPNQWEIRLCTGHTNFYIAFCALLTAGTWGLRNGAPLVGECRGLPWRLTEGARVNNKIVRKLPEGMREALDVLIDDREFGSAVGREMVDGYLMVKHEEWGSWSKTWVENETRYLTFF